MNDVDLGGGWNSARLDDLARDVEDIKRTLGDAPRLRDIANDIADMKRQIAQRHDEEKEQMRKKITELEDRPRQIIIAFAVPIFVGLIIWAITHAL